jgi:hypothetical protein
MLDSLILGHIMLDFLASSCGCFEETKSLRRSRYALFGQIMLETTHVVKNTIICPNGQLMVFFYGCSISKLLEK